MKNKKKDFERFNGETKLCDLLVLQSIKKPHPKKRNTQASLYFKTEIWGATWLVLFWKHSAEILPLVISVLRRETSFCSTRIMYCALHASPWRCGCHLCSTPPDASQTCYSFRFFASSMSKVLGFVSLLHLILSLSLRQWLTWGHFAPWVFFFFKIAPFTGFLSWRLS